jgi:hypothetical protein
MGTTQPCNWRKGLESREQENGDYTKKGKKLRNFLSPLAAFIQKKPPLSSWVIYSFYFL